MGSAVGTKVLARRGPEGRSFHKTFKVNLKMCHIKTCTFIIYFSWIQTSILTVVRECDV